MKIWFLEPPEDTTEYPPLEIGRYLADNDALKTGCLAAVNAGANEAALAADVAAWLIPAGLSSDMELVQRVAKNQSPIMLSVNGLGAIAYAAISALVPADKLINLFDAREQDSISFLEQLTWLNAQTSPFAVMAGNSEKLVQAAAMGAAHLIIAEPNPVDMTSIMRVVIPRQAGSPRPTSATEIDHLVGRESSLTVNRPLAAGHRLDSDDLTVAITATRGLSPMLGGRIKGRILRYDIAPGEPLTFGHLMVEDFS